MKRQLNRGSLWFLCLTDVVEDYLLFSHCLAIADVVEDLLML